MLEIMLAYLPHDNSLFEEELEDFPADQPLMKWFAEKDAFSWHQTDSLCLWPKQCGPPHAGMQTNDLLNFSAVITR